MKISNLFYVSALLIFMGLQVQAADKNSQTPAMTPNEIDKRINLAINRVYNGNVPTFTTDFILADLSLKPAFERRYTDYSGDLSGRYIQALALVQPLNNPIDIHALVKEALTYQKKDGRFGSDALSFEMDKIDDAQMALLWGNGRLLAGLVDYYKVYHNKEVLASAVKLGNFIANISETLAKPEMAEKFNNSKSSGYICFTQLAEGLVSLYDITADKNYLATAKTAYRFLPEKGKQHTHGYLNSLLGVLLLHQRSGEQADLQFAKTRFDAILNSPDYLISGGVSEYFGNYTRDEGCSEADFMMVAFKLWEITADQKYLETAERCMVNHFFFNQFSTGDFGHHGIDGGKGFLNYGHVPLAWWCCDFHGIRGLHESKKECVTEKEGAVSLNLFFPGTYTASNSILNITKENSQSAKYVVDLKKFSAKNLKIRKPRWAKSINITVNGNVIPANDKDDYVTLNQAKTGDKVTIELNYKLQFKTEKGEIFTAENAPATKFKAAIFYGPYLMSVDDHFQLEFMAEPSTENCLVYKTGFQNCDKKFIPETSFCSEAYLKTAYKHATMYGEHPVILRPMAETTYQYPGNTRLWFNFE